jgi:hypothetical protein
MLYFDWVIRVVFKNSICIILATGDYTEQQELNQFETITDDYYTCGIDFPVLFFIFWHWLRHYTSPDNTVVKQFRQE